MNTFFISCHYPASSVSPIALKYPHYDMQHSNGNLSSMSACFLTAKLTAGSQPVHPLSLQYSFLSYEMKSSGKPFLLSLRWADIDLLLLAELQMSTSFFRLCFQQKRSDRICVGMWGICYLLNFALCFCVLAYIT